MNELVPVVTKEIQGTKTQLVNARLLWEYLESKADFSTWIKSQLSRAMSVENRDYFSFHKKVEREVGATVRKEYALTLDTAKHIAMLSGTEKGREVREYFIECEKQLSSIMNPAAKTQLSIGQTANDMLDMAERWGFKGNQAKLSADKATKALTGYSPLALMGQTMLIAEKKEITLTAGQLGKRVGMGAREMNLWLTANEFQTRDRIDGKLVYEPTEKGKEFSEVVDASKANVEGGTPVKQLRWYSSMVNQFNSIEGDA